MRLSCTGGSTGSNRPGDHLWLLSSWLNCWRILEFTSEFLLHRNKFVVDFWTFPFGIIVQASSIRTPRTSFSSWRNNILRHLKWGKLLQPFPWQSRDRRPKQFWKLMVCLFMNIYVILVIYFVKSAKYLISVCELHFFINVSRLYQHIFIAHAMWTHIWLKVYICYTYTYSCFIVCIEYYGLRMRTKFCRSCPCHRKGWAGLI